MAELINIKVKINIEQGDVENINFKKFKLMNAKGVKMKVIDTPEGFDEVEGEYWVELINIKKGVEYENIHIISKQLEEPVVIGDVFIELPQPEVEEAEEDYDNEEAGSFEDESENEGSDSFEEEAEEAESFEEEVIEEEVEETESFEEEANEEEVEVAESFEEEIEEEVEEAESFEEDEEETISATEARLNALHAAIEVTKGYEAEFEVADAESLQANAVAKTQDEKVTEIETRLAALLKQQKEVQAAYDSLMNSANDPEISEEVRAKLLADAQVEADKLEGINSEVEREREILASERATQKELRSIANEKSSIAHALERKIISSRKTEEKIKAAILNDAANKIAKATKESKTTVKLENQAAALEFEARNEFEFAAAAQARYEELYKEIESLKIKAEATEDEDERAIIEAQIAKLDSLLRIAENEVKKHTNAANKLKSKEEAVLIKAHKESEKVKDIAEEAKVAMEAAKEVKGMRISDLEKQASSVELTERERESLTQEIRFLKLQLQGEAVTVEERTNPTTEEVYNVVGAFDMSKTEKWIKNTFKKTYWIIYERGSRSRDSEFEDFLAKQDSERQALIIEIEQKQQEAQAQIEADKAAASKEIQDIKDNAKEAAEKLRAEAMAEQERAKAEIEAIKEKARAEKEAADAKFAAEKAEAEEKIAKEKAEAEAEIERVKSEGQKAIAEQKDEIEAKVKEAERMIEADKVKHEEIENNLKAQIQAAKDEAEAAKAETARVAKELEAEKAASEAEAKAKIAAVEKVKDELDKAVQEAHHRVLTVQEEAELAKKEAERMKETHQEHVATTKEQHEKILADAKIAVEKIQNESKNNIDDLLKQIAELEAKIESLEKSKAVADKKAALLQQIEQLVEDDIKN